LKKLEQTFTVKMFGNSFYSSKMERAKIVWSADDDSQSFELSDDNHVGEDSSSCRFIDNGHMGKETKEQHQMSIERNRILRRKGPLKTSGTRRFNTARPESSIGLGDLIDDNSDSSTRTDSSYSSSKANIAKSSIENELVANDSMSLEVLREGSKFMKSIKLPTIFTRITNYILQPSTVYYVTLEAESEEFVGQIPALMFSSNYSSDMRTDLAELLPLRVTRREWSEFLSLGPILRRGRYKRMFGKGCSFKIIALSSIRVVDSSVECPWKSWELNIAEMQKVVKDIIYEDIRQIPKSILKTLEPLKCNETFKKPRSLSEKKVSLLQILSKETKLSERSREGKLSDYCSDLEFTGLAVRGGSSFAEWFKTIPPNVRVDQNFKCKRGTILTKDNFNDLKTLEKYLRISEEV